MLEDVVNVVVLWLEVEVSVEVVELDWLGETSITAWLPCWKWMKRREFELS